MERARGVVAVTERDEEGRPFMMIEEGEGEGEELRHVQPGVAIVLGDRTPYQPGTLYITTRRLIWLSDTDSRGYAVDFLSLSMHAISRDPEAYPSPCIYTQIQCEDDEYEDESEEELESEPVDDEDLGKMHEMRLVPSDPSILDHMFQVLCDCATLNPDPVGELEGEAEWFYNEEEVANGVLGESNGIGYFDITAISKLDIDEGRFEDADEMEEEEH